MSATPGPAPTPPANATPFACVLRAWQAHEHELLAHLLHHTHNREQAEDLLQDVFLKSLRQGRSFCELDNPRAWLFRVARNAAIDAARLAKPFDELSYDSIAAPTTEREPVDELDACMVRNLTELDDADRDILQRCDLQGQTVRAYAQARGLSLAAAKSRLLRARTRLRERLVTNCQVRFDAAGHVCCHVPRPAG